MSPDIPKYNLLEAQGLVNRAYVRSRRIKADLLLVQYSYQVESKEYFGESVIPIPSMNKDKTMQLQRQLELLQPGRTITIWYDQLNPKKSHIHYGLLE